MKFIIDNGSETFSFTVGPNDTIEDLKYKYEALDNVPPSDQILYTEGGRELEDHVQLATIFSGSGGTLRLMTKKRRRH